MRITIQIALAVVILIAGIFIGRMTLNNNLVSTENTTKTDSIGLLPAFKEIKIGEQIWMVENLNVDTFRDGTKIREAKTSEEWQKLGDARQPAWCYYNNQIKNGEKYGKLYNWYAVRDPRGLAPEGYHIPSDTDWEILVDAMGGIDVAGYKLKGKAGWQFNKGESCNGSNESGFSAPPGGFRSVSSNGFVSLFSGVFVSVGYTCHWWSSTKEDENEAFYCFMQYDDDKVNRSVANKGSGFSVRCLRD